MKNESNNEISCHALWQSNAPRAFFRSQLSGWRKFSLAVVLLAGGSSASFALDLPWTNSEVSAACQEPLGIRAKAQADYRSCIRLAPGREMIKEKHCKSEKTALKAAEKEVSKCKIWASHKIAEEYTPKSEGVKG